MKQDYFLTQYKRKTQNVFKDINIRSETVKLLEETIGSMPFDISLSDIYIFFFAMFPQARETKAKINKWSYIKLRCFCTAKETMNKWKAAHFQNRRICL